jgi:hypothetical protein
MRPTITLICLLTIWAPGLATAGDLEPPGPPGPTMKTLDEIPPTWNRRLDTADGEPGGCNSTRFKCVFADLVVLDMETGLVWQRTPSSDTNTQLGALGTCYSLSLSSLRGWRPPTTAELTSLMSNSWRPSLPLEHPFLNVGWNDDPPIYYVTMTTWQDSSGHMYVIAAEFAQARVGQRPIENNEFRSWCVRGPE